MTKAQVPSPALSMPQSTRDNSFIFSGVDFIACLILNRFFHQNVGASAWGIAIHEHSRLIAVSSNAREITIFAHGYAVADPEDAITELSDDSEEDTCLGGHVFLTLEAFPVMMMFGSSTHVRDRHLGNYRIVFNLGNRGHNIPSIDL
jgi:hypothetical protein